MYIYIILYFVSSFCRVIEEQIKLRDNAIEQANLLKEYKQLFVHHPSHRINATTNNNKSKYNKQDSGGGLLSIFVSLLTEPLSRTGMMRSNDDHLTVELILHLFRNLLCAGEPLLKDHDNTRESAKLHQELISLFEQELVLDVLVMIGQEMENRENAQYNLLIMEIMHHLLKSQVRFVFFGVNKYVLFCLLFQSLSLIIFPFFFLYWTTI